MRFHIHRRSSSLRRLRTAFSSSWSTQSHTPDASPTSTPPMSRAISPAARYTSASPLSSHSDASSSSSIREVLASRRRPTVIDSEMDEEARTFPAEVGVLEPRPRTGPVAGGIFEVLDGSV